MSERTKLAVAAAFLCAAPCLPARATEGGGTNWASGVQTVYPALVPPPGQTYWQNYFVVLSNSAFSSNIRRSSVPGFRATAIANAARLFHSWNAQLLGAQVSSSAILAVNTVDIRAAGSHGSAFGLSWLYLAPIYLTWNTPTLHLSLGEGAFIPVGSFSRTDIANESTGIWGFNQEAAFTWMPNKRFDVSAEAEIQINAKNSVSNYRSGHVINIDFGANYMVAPTLPQLRIGLNGFVTKQFTDDKLDGRTYNNGNRLSKFALGPQVLWFFRPPYAVALKYQHEMGVENSTRGDRYWLQFQIPL